MSSLVLMFGRFAASSTMRKAGHSSLQILVLSWQIAAHAVDPVHAAVHPRIDGSPSARLCLKARCTVREEPIDPLSSELSSTAI